MFSLCQTSLVILEQIIPQLNIQENILREFTGFYNHRTKRSYRDGVERIFIVLLGTLDAD